MLPWILLLGRLCRNQIYITLLRIHQWNEALPIGKCLCMMPPMEVVLSCFLIRNYAPVMRGPFRVDDFILSSPFGECIVVEVRMMVLAVDVECWIGV